MVFKLLINGDDYTKNLPLPFATQNSLDESLDFAQIQLTGTTESEAFKPLSSVVIEVDNKKFVFFVSSDEVTELVYFKGRYNHSISLIEQSKWLERFTGITKTNTNSLIKDYTDIQRFCEIVYYINGEEKARLSTDVLGEPYSSNLKTPFVADELIVPSAKTLIEKLQQPVADFENKFVSVRSETPYIDSTNTVWNVEDRVNMKGVVGDFTITYLFEATPIKWEFVIEGYSVGQTTPPKYTITDVINDLLATCECLNDVEKQRFTLNEEQALEFKGIDAPEFSLIGTLWECLSEIGGFLHAIPRLQDNIIYFDKLGCDTKTGVDLSDYCSCTKRFDIEQYATHLDSTIDNLVNTSDVAQGTITAPFATGLKTVRTDSGQVQLTTDNIFIETKEPIEQVISLECGYVKLNGKDFYVGDITPFVYESAEYEGLSQFFKTNEETRALAIKYTQGQKNITELSYKAPNAVPIMSKLAIINIIAKKLGVLPSFVDDSNILNLQFRIKYIPVISARLRQSKSCIEDLGIASSMDFNQSANKVNSFAYGENMKGTLARLGNPELSKMYIFKDLNNIPKVGDLFNDDYYISLVRLEFYNNFYKCEIVLSKNFNKISEYIGINSQKRFYEVSEKQAVERYINYNDYCIVADARFNVKSDGYSLITTKGLTAFGDTFKNKTIDTFKNHNIDLVIENNIYKEQRLTRGMILPITSLGIGNSIAFNFHFDDNFSAGNTRTPYKNAEFQNMANYTDLYGQVEKMNLYFGKGKNDKIIDFESAVYEGNKLPVSQGSNTDVDSYFDTYNKTPSSIVLPQDIPLLIKKDNREVLNITYQVDFVGYDRSFIIGQAMTQKCSFVTDEIVNFKIYTLQREIGKFETKIDTTNATLEVDNINNIVVLGEDYTILFGGFTATTDAKSIVLVTENNEIAIARNLSIKQGQKVPAFQFTFTHKIK